MVYCIMRCQFIARLEKLEREIKGLSPEEVADLRDWFRQYDAEAWDRQIEEDVRAGKLDRLAEEALAAPKARRKKEL